MVQQTDPTRAPVPEPVHVTRPLCRFTDLVDGASRGFDPLDEGRDTMFAVRRGEAVFAWRNVCPHYDRARMAWKKDEFLNGDKSHIICGAHGALFEIDTGLCILGPCLGQSLTPVAVERRGDELWLTDPYLPGLRPRAGRSHA